MVKRFKLPKISFKTGKNYFIDFWLLITKTLLWAVVVSFLIFLFSGNIISIYDVFVSLIVFGLIPISILKQKNRVGFSRIKSILLRYQLVVALQVVYVLALSIYSCQLATTKAVNCGEPDVVKDFGQMLLIQLIILIGLIGIKLIFSKIYNSKIIKLANNIFSLSKRLHHRKIHIGIWIIVLIGSFLFPNFIYQKYKTDPVLGTSIKLIYPIRDFFPWYNFSFWQNFSDPDKGFVWHNSLVRQTNNPNERVLFQIGIIEGKKEPLKMTLSQLFSPGSDNRVNMLVLDSNETEANLDYIIDLIKAVVYQSDDQFESRKIGNRDWKIIHFFQEEGEELIIYNRWYLSEIDSKIVIIRTNSLGYGVEAFEEVEDIVERI